MTGRFFSVSSTEPMPSTMRSYTFCVLCRKAEPNTHAHARMHQSHGACDIPGAAAGARACDSHVCGMKQATLFSSSSDTRELSSAQ